MKCDCTPKRGETDRLTAKVHILHVNESSMEGVEVGASNTHTHKKKHRLKTRGREREEE